MSIVYAIIICSIMAWRLKKGIRVNRDIMRSKYINIIEWAVVMWVVVLIVFLSIKTKNHLLQIAYSYLYLGIGGVIYYGYTIRCARKYVDKIKGIKKRLFKAYLGLVFSVISILFSFCMMLYEMKLI